MVLFQFKFCLASSFALRGAFPPRGADFPTPGCRFSHPRVPGWGTPGFRGGAPRGADFPTPGCRFSHPGVPIVPPRFLFRIFILFAELLVYLTSSLLCLLLYVLKHVILSISLCPLVIFLHVCLYIYIYIYIHMYIYIYIHICLFLFKYSWFSRCCFRFSIC